MSTPEVGAFVASIRKPRSGFLDIFILLMPLLEQLFAQIMENCATTEDRAVDLATDPRGYQVRRAEGRALRKFRRQTEFTKLSRNERKQLVTEMVADTIDAANAEPEMVAAAWRSVQ